jgi:hypothetical protein
MKKYILPLVLLFAGLLFMLFPSLFLPGKIDLTIKPVAFIMPVAYKVYSNPDVVGGHYNLFSAIIKNTGSAEINNLRLQYRVPKYIDDWKDVPMPADLRAGQEVVVTCFPVFNQAITTHKTSSKEKTDIRFFYGNKSNPTEKDASFVFDMTSINDIILSDTNDKGKVDSAEYANNCALYACMATSQDPLLKYYAANIQEKLMTAGVPPYRSEQEIVKESVLLMKVIYYATAVSKIVYSETSAGTSQFGSNTTATEHIRLPREVLFSKTGSCAELALFNATLLKTMGYHAVIFLIPGHAFPGFKLGNYYYAIESTGIGGAGLLPVMTPDQAYREGMKEAKVFFIARQKGVPGYYLIDLEELDDEGYKEIELNDDQSLREKVDQLWKGLPKTTELDYQCCDSFP